MYILFLMVSLGSVVAQNETKYDHSSYTNVMDAITGVSNCTYATKNFNPVCVEDSLPALNEECHCPVNNDGSINEENLKQILIITEDRLKLPEMCNKTLNPILLPFFAVNIDQFLPPPFSGECASDLTYRGLAECKLKFIPEDWTGSIYFNISFRINVDINAKCSFSANNDNPHFTIDSANITVDPEMLVFNNSLLAKVKEYFTDKITEYAQNSTVPIIFANFISTITVEGIIATCAKKS
ncbi:hypothetical protein CHUAL_006501 [Chamberlinius hualienensis]